MFLHGSFLDIPLEDNFFDCTVSLHTIYHIDKQRQEEAVRKLLRVTKPGRPVIIVYSNPRPFGSSLKPLSRLARKVANLAKSRDEKAKQDEAPLYFHCHRISWWNRFNDVATVRILLWRSFHADVQKRWIPDNRLGKRMFEVLYNLEERFPGFFAKRAQYPMIVLAKTVC